MSPRTLEHVGECGDRQRNSGRTKVTSGQPETTQLYQSCLPSASHAKATTRIDRQMVVNYLYSSIPRLGPAKRRRKPPELSSPRILLHELITTRTGHGQFAAYDRRFKHEDANLVCSCGIEKKPTPFMRCRRYNILTRKLRKDMSLDAFTRQLLGHKD